MCPIGGIWKQADNCHQETPFQTHEKATDDSHVHLTDASKAGDQNKQLRHMKNHQKSRPSHPSAGHACPSPPEVMLTQKIREPIGLWFTKTPTPQLWWEEVWVWLLSSPISGNGVAFCTASLYSENLNFCYLRIKNASRGNCSCPISLAMATI